MIESVERERIEQSIRALFLMPIEADQRAIQMTCSAQEVDDYEELSRKKEYLSLLQAGKEMLWCVLSDPEKLVIQRHYVDGLDWPCVIEEFVQRWGEDARKTSRSMINHQNRGFRKMADYVVMNWNIFDFSWLFTIH